LLKHIHLSEVYNAGRAATAALLAFSFHLATTSQSNPPPGAEPSLRTPKSITPGSFAHRYLTTMSIDMQGSTIPAAHPASHRRPMVFVAQLAWASQCKADGPRRRDRWKSIAPRSVL